MTRLAPTGEKPALLPGKANSAAVERAARIAIEALQELGIRNEYTVLVGGGTLDSSSAAAVGADACSGDISALVNAAMAVVARH